MGRAREGVLWPIPHSIIGLGTQGEDEPEPEETIEKNPHAVALGRLGGQKSGKAQSKELMYELRKEIAQKAARLRWSKHKP